MLSAFLKSRERFRKSFNRRVAFCGTEDAGNRSEMEIRQMKKNVGNSVRSPYKGSGSLTREQFYFYEMRTTARLLLEGLSEKETVEKIVAENLFQYPTERTIKKAATVCIQRLKALKDDDLVKAIAERDSYTAKQICLYAMMKKYRIIWDFMITIIGMKYRQQDMTFKRQDINVFFMQLQEQDDTVASWSESTIKKIGSVFSRILIENEYISSGRSKVLQPVLITSVLENAIRAAGQEIALPAFNCLG